MRAGFHDCAASLRRTRNMGADLSREAARL
jgi:hypothetical protein